MAAYGGIDVEGVLSLAMQYAELVREDGDHQDALSCLERGIRTFEQEVRTSERDRWSSLLAEASRIAENNIKRADDCGMLSRVLLNALNLLRE
jgi:hypothetical protein